MPVYTMTLPQLILASFRSTHFSKKFAKLFFRLVSVFLLVRKKIEDLTLILRLTNTLKPLLTEIEQRALGKDGTYWGRD